MIQGPCYENQIEIYKKKIIEFCNDFMREFSYPKDFKIKGFTDPRSIEYINELITMNIKLLNSMIEGNQELKICQKMSYYIDFNILIEKLCLYYNEFKRKYHSYWKNGHFKFLPKDAFHGKISEAFNIMFFIRCIDAKTEKYK